MDVIVLKETDTRQEGQYSLIHIPLPLYSLLLQPILQVLLPFEEARDVEDAHVDPEGHSSGKHQFLNISVTPIECSVVCLSTWAQKLFKPVIDRLPEEISRRVHISEETYNVFSVNSAGIEAGQRVIDLTAPLALAGIPIFFITTYYTDFILVPSKDRHTVGQALLARGFEFSEDDSVYVSPTTSSRSNGSTSTSLTSDPSIPPTPPPTDVHELQSRTFAQLRKRNVKPFISPHLHIVQCSGKDPSADNETRPSPNGHTRDHSTISWLSTIDSNLYLGLVSALTQQPRFLSITLGQEDAPSILVDKTLTHLFGSSITGDTEGDLVPIFLDLVDLPLESTGIVCGVAGRLVEEMRRSPRVDDGEGLEGNGGGKAAELSYLSTARAGAVMLTAGGAERALEMLGRLLEEDGGAGGAGGRVDSGFSL